MYGKNQKALREMNDHGPGREGQWKFYEWNFFYFLDCF